MSDSNTSIDWGEVDRLFELGLRVTIAQRESWLQDVASDNPLLIEQVRKLLAADASNQENSFLESADSVATQWLAGNYLKTDTVGPYRIVERIGSGGFGAVFKVLPVDSSSRRSGIGSPSSPENANEGSCNPENDFLALKIIHPWTLDAAAYRRFLTEQRVLQRIDHPHVVRFIDAGVHDGLPYLVMQYVDGQTLDQVLRAPDGSIDCNRIPLATRIDWFRMICEGVAAAHHQLILHRDLKPGNIIIDRSGRAIVTDFGLAKSLSAQQTVSLLTSKGHLVGTLPFMSPEQIRGEFSLQLSSDVYGLGALLYFLLTGQPPNRSNDFAQTCRSIATDTPQSLLGFDTSISRDLETICLHCLNKTPSRRYLSAERLLDDVKLYLDGLPIHARPVGKIERAYYWVRRSPAVAGLSAALIMLGLTSLIIFAALWSETRRSYQKSVHRNQQLLAMISQLTNQVQIAESDPRTLRLQAEMLRTVTDGYRDLASEFPLDIPTLRSAAAAWFKLGRAESQQGNRNSEFRAYQHAEECVRNILLQEDGNIEDHFDLFHCVAAQDRLEEALEIIQQVVQQDPTQDPYYRDALCDTLLRITAIEIKKGVTQQLREQVEQCHSIASELVQENPDRAIFWVKLGQYDGMRCQVALVDGDADQAIYQYGLCIKNLGIAHNLDPLHAGTFFEFANALCSGAAMALANDDSAQALSCLEQLESLIDNKLSIFSGYARALFLKAKFLRIKMLFSWSNGEMSRFADCRRQYERELRKRLSVVPDCAYAQSELAWLISEPSLTATPDLELALELIRSAAEHSDTYPVHDLMGQIHYRRGEWHEALECFEQHRLSIENNLIYMGQSADFYRIYRMSIDHDSRPPSSYLYENHDLSDIFSDNDERWVADRLEWVRHVFHGHIITPQFFAQAFEVERRFAIEAWKQRTGTLDANSVVKSAVDSAKND